jgi:hypothetical protein
MKNISPESELGKEFAKWNKPYVFDRFPIMLYMARQREDGIVRVAETDDKQCGGKPGAAEVWTMGNQRIAKNEDEFLKLKGQGWAETAADAMELFEKRRKEVSTAAAHRAYEDRNMSEAAKAEAAVVEAAQFEHVAEVPEKPAKRKYTRRVKPEAGV